MKLLLLLATAGLLLAGCAPTLAPHTPYMPMMRHRGEAEARLATGLNGHELQLGYQATDRLVLHAALLRAGGTSSGRSFRSADIGLGYYHLSANGLWRLGGHAGLAYAGGTSGSSSCFECGAEGSSSEFSMRYTYAYVQPTALLITDDVTWGFGLRLGQTYYFQLDELQTDAVGLQPQAFDHAGHTSTFIQPTLQLSYRLLPWLALSSSSGVQAFFGSYSKLNTVNPFMGQVGLHFMLWKQLAPRL